MVHKRVTIVQLARFGDLMQTSPLIQSLRSACSPQCEITLIVDSRAAKAAKLLYGVDHVVPVDLKSAAAIQKNHPLQQYRALKDWAAAWVPSTTADDLYLLNQGSLTESIASLVPARKRHGPGRGSMDDRPHRLLTALLSDRTLNPLHLSEIWGAYADPSSRLPRPKLRKRGKGTGFAFLAENDPLKSYNNKLYAVNMGAGSAGRTLMEEKLAALTEDLLNDDAGIVLFLGTQVDVSKGDRTISILPPPMQNRVRNLAGKTSLEELAGILESADALVSSDTGTLQLAAATNTPAVGLFFGGANPVETGPWYDRSVALTAGGIGQAREFDLDDLKYAAALAEGLAKNENVEDMIDASITCDLLVARPAPVGFRYYTVAGQNCHGRGARWIPWLRYLLGDQQCGGQTDRKVVPENEGTVELAHGLIDVIRKIDTNRGKLDPKWDDEVKWLARITAAFPVETMRWVELVTTKRQEKEAGV
jgi:ADP-heptose:LPS heptosyltransferase